MPSYQHIYICHVARVKTQCFDSLQFYRCYHELVKRSGMFLFHKWRRLCYICRNLNTVLLYLNVIYRIRLISRYVFRWATRRDHIWSRIYINYRRERDHPRFLVWFLLFCRLYVFFVVYYIYSVSFSFNAYILLQKKYFGMSIWYYMYFMIMEILSFYYRI